MLRERECVNRQGFRQAQSLPVSGKGETGMAWGAVLRKGQAWYTDLGVVFETSGILPEDYNWLVTDWECNQDVAQLTCTHAAAETGADGIRFCWLTGTQLSDMLRSHRHLQWIWGVLSGFETGIALEQVLEYPLPGADDNRIWENPVFVRHPLAEIEIVPWDSSMVFFVSRKKEPVRRFREGFVLSEDLTEQMFGKGEL